MTTTQPSKITKAIQDKARDASHAIGRAEMLFKAAYIMIMDLVEPPTNEYFESDRGEIIRELLGTGIELLENRYSDIADVSMAIGYDIDTGRQEHSIPPQLTEMRQVRRGKSAKAA